jgi:hypothetical protein
VISTKLQVVAVFECNEMDRPTTLSAVASTASIVTTATASSGSGYAANTFSQAVATPVRPAPSPLQKTNSADPFLEQAILLAEAAKRAQLAVMMRDFDDCSLS